jgi:hypothetical protein
MLEADLQAKYEAADKLAQNPVQMELLKKYKGAKRDYRLKCRALGLAEMRLRKLLIPGREGWVLLPENPEDGEQQELGSEAVKSAREWNGGRSGESG